MGPQTALEQAPGIPPWGIASSLTDDDLEELKGCVDLGKQHSSTTTWSSELPPSCPRQVAAHLHLPALLRHAKALPRLDSSATSHPCLCFSRQRAAASSGRPPLVPDLV